MKDGGVIIAKNKVQVTKLLPVFELFGISTVFFIIDLFRGLFGYIHFFPNPYLLITIFTASRHSIVFGLTNSILNVLYQYISIYTNIVKNNGDLSLIYSFDFAKYPIVYLVTAFIFGLLKELDTLRIKNAEQQVKDREKIIDDLKEILRRHKDAIQDLKEKLSLENKGISLLVERLREMQISKPEDIYNEGVELISNFIGAENVSIYTLDASGFLRVKVRKGEGILPNSLRPDDSIVLKYALKDGTANINVQIITDEQGKLPVEPAIASTIKNGDNLIGIIIIEIIDPFKLNKNTETYLKVIGDWFATMLASSQSITHELEILTTNADGTIRIEYYESYFEDYKKRWDRFRMPFSLLKVKTGEAHKEEILKIKRKMDIVFSEKNEQEVVLTFLLGVCDSQGLQKVLERLKNKSGKEFEIITSWSSDNDG
jgi:hypothetical protein